MQLLQTSLGIGLKLSYQKEDTVIGGQIARSGLYEPFEEELLLSRLQGGDSAIDIGANIGVYTLQMAQKVGQEGQIYAFEPEPTNAEILRKNAVDNGFENVAIFPFALSNKAEETLLYKSLDNFGDHRIYDGAYERKRQTIIIETKRLDDVLGKETSSIAVIKIDTQGYEPFVIHGARKTIARDKPNIFLEYWPFAYKKAHADTKGMLNFLFSVYPYAFMINGKMKKLLPFTRDLISEGIDEWSNLLFTSENSF